MIALKVSCSRLTDPSHDDLVVAKGMGVCERGCECVFRGMSLTSSSSGGPNRQLLLIASVSVSGGNRHPEGMLVISIEEESSCTIFQAYDCS